MKLAFSTKGWHGRSFAELCDIAAELRFGGIELHNVRNDLFTAQNSAFHDYAAASTRRVLYEKKLKIPCIDSICDPADAQKTEDSFAELEECIRIAANLRIPYIRIHASSHGEAGDVEHVKQFIEKILPMAEQDGVTLLLETSGLFADTESLRNVLEYFACDGIAALWD